MIQLTGVASRYVGFVVALMLIVLGLFPAVSGFVQHIPEPVLGGATLVMFGTIAASGVRIVSREPLNRPGDSDYRAVAGGWSGRVSAAADFAVCP